MSRAQQRQQQQQQQQSPQQQRVQSPIVPPIALSPSHHSFLLDSPSMSASSPYHAAVVPPAPRENGALRLLRWIAVLTSVLVVFTTRNALANGFVALLDSVASFLATNASSASRFDQPLGCSTNTVVDTIALLTILFHHEIKLVFVFWIAVSVDVCISLIIRYVTAYREAQAAAAAAALLAASNNNSGTATPPSSSPASSSSASPLAGAAAAAQHAAASPNSNNGALNLNLSQSNFSVFDSAGSSPSHHLRNSSASPASHAASPTSFIFESVLTPRTVTHQVTALWIPEGYQARLIATVVLLLLFGVDLGDASIRFMSLSVSRPLYQSTKHPQWRDRKGSAYLKGNSQENQRTAATATVKATGGAIVDDLDSGPSKPHQQRVFIGASTPIIATNRHLECELSHAIVSPGLVILSGPRGTKSTTARQVIANRSGFFCDVHRAASPESFTETVEKCIEEHSILNSVPSAWQSLTLAVRHFLAMWLWKIAWFDSLATAFFVASWWERRESSASSTVSASSMTISDTDFLVRRCGGGKNSDKNDGEQHLPLLFVLDGVRDSNAGALGLLDLVPSVLSTMQKVADIATIVIIAASDDTLSSLHQLPHLQFTNSVASRVAFVTASPAEIAEVKEVYKLFGKQSLRGGCDADVECAAEVFGGGFTWATQWASICTPVPADITDPGALHRFCNAALRTVIAAAFSITDSVSGWQMSSMVDSVNNAVDPAATSAASSSSSSSGSFSSSSTSTSKEMSFRLRSLYFMLELAQRSSISITSCDPDVLHKFVQAQLVFEETVQFPACQFDNRNFIVPDGAGGEKVTDRAGTIIRAVAPRLLNVSIAHILSEKRERIDEALQLLVDECVMRKVRLRGSGSGGRGAERSAGAACVADSAAASNSFFGSIFGSAPAQAQLNGEEEQPQQQHERKQQQQADDVVSECRRTKFVSELRRRIDLHRHWIEKDAEMVALTKKCDRALLI